MNPDTTPYRSQALQYLESGLGYPIPSAYPFEKSPPLTGWTGRRGAMPSKAQVHQWMETHPDSNILLRLAPNVIGIDVDDYDDKHGVATRGRIGELHGMLPPTSWSTARKYPSGIYWFRLRIWMDTDKMRDPGEHVEVIRHEHRYAVVPPSWNPSARARYRWSDNAMPHVTELPYLPTEWYVHLNRGCSCFEEERAERRRLSMRLSNRAPGLVGVNQARRDIALAANALANTSEGSRNNMLSSIAGRFILYDVVINNVLSLDEVTGLMMAAAKHAGLDARETERTIQSAIEWATREGEQE